MGTVREQCYCKKCKKVLSKTEFYLSNNKEKYKNGIIDICKKCLTMHVDNWEPETFLWILQEADVPYIQEEWRKLMAKYCMDPSKVTGTTIIGRYLGKMKLKQYKDYRWKDNEFLQKLYLNNIEETMKGQGYSASEIAEVISEQQIAFKDEELEIPDLPPRVSAEKGPLPFLQLPDKPDITDIPAEGNFQNSFDEITDSLLSEKAFEDQVAEFGLTEEDVRYLKMKWGSKYKPEEWVKLEQLYTEMTNSYDIQSAGHIDNLKLLCKTSLKANQLIDINDVEGFQKMQKAYESLMKSGKFTAAQNKAEEGEYVDSISELVLICEEKGFIPRYYTDGPQDKVDRVIEDLQRYTKTLVTEEMGLGNLIENAIKQIELDKQKEELEDDVDIDEEQVFEDDLFDYEKNNIVLDDSDFADFRAIEESWEDSDNAFLQSLTNGVGDNGTQ